MKKVLHILTALLVGLSVFAPMIVIDVQAEQYGWIDADERYLVRDDHSGYPDAIRIQLAYTAGMHAYSDETVFGDPEHYGYTSEVIELHSGQPYTWHVSSLNIDCWDYYNPDLYTQDTSHSSSDDDYAFVTWDEGYPDWYMDQFTFNGNLGSPGWEVMRRVYFGTIDFTFTSTGGLEYDMDLKLSATRDWPNPEEFKIVRNQSFALERPYGTDPLYYVHSDHQQVDLYFRLLSIHYSETPPEPAPTPYVVHSDADSGSGEQRFPIPAAVAGAAGLAGALWLLTRKKKPSKGKKNKQEETEEEEPSRYEMRIRKQFGDKIYAGDARAVYAKIVEVKKDGTERDMDQFSQEIRVQSGTFLQVQRTEYANGYMGAAIYAPLSNDVPDTGTVVFNFRGMIKINLRFRIGGCMIISDPATGAERIFHETEKGFWLSLDGQTVLDPARVAEWMEQRRKDRAYMDQQNIKLEQGRTAFDREMAKIKQDYLAEVARIDEESKRTIYNLSHFGSTDEKYIRATVERRTKLAEAEGRAQQRRAAVYHCLYYGAYATKYATDKAFDVIGSAGGVTGKIGKALYTIAVDQTGAISEAVVEGKNVGHEMAKAGIGSIFSIVKDNTGGVTKFVTMVGGGSIKSMSAAMIDGKSSFEVVREGMLGAAKGTFEWSMDMATDGVKQLIGAGEHEIDTNLFDKDVLRIKIDVLDIGASAGNDLANGIYEVAEEGMDDFVKRTQHR